MSLKIRLTRGGAKKRPYYRIVVADARSPARRPLHREGRHLRPDEAEGRCRPHHPRSEKIQAWLAKGAQPTDRVLRFLDAAGLMKRNRRATTPQRPCRARRPRSAPTPRQRPQRLLPSLPRRSGVRLDEAGARLPSPGGRLALREQRRGGGGSADLRGRAYPAPPLVAPPQGEGDPVDACSTTCPSRRIRPRPWPQGRSPAEILHRPIRWRSPLTARSSPIAADPHPQIRPSGSRRRARSADRAGRGRRDPRERRGAEPHRLYHRPRQASAARRRRRIPARRPDRTCRAVASTARYSAPSWPCRISAAATSSKSSRRQAAPTALLPFTLAFVPEVTLRSGAWCVDPPDDLFAARRNRCRTRRGRGVTFRATILTLYPECFPARSACRLSGDAL